jgi:hypothetical protein
MLADTIAHVGGGTTPAAFAWDADAHGFTRTSLPRNPDGTFATSAIVLVHHVLGTDPATDAYVFGRGLSPKAEYHLLAAPAGNALAAVVADGDGVPAWVYVRRGSGAFVQVATPAAGIGSSAEAGAAFIGDVLAVIAKWKTLTRNPERYRAVDAAVGFYDLLRVELTPNGAFNTPEFGTVTDPQQFAWMVQQSPYHHVRNGVAYPAVLMTTGENDPRVDPYNSRKMVALLQADSASPYPVLLLQKSGEGHGIGNSFAQRVESDTERYAFFLSQLGP